MTQASTQHTSQSATQSQCAPRGGKAKQKRPSGPMQVRIKFLPPTIAEAVAAARDIAEDIEGQVEIAAGFMGVEPDAVREEVLRADAEAKKAAEKIESGSQVMVRDKSGSARTVVVQRTRRPASRPVVVERTNRFGTTPSGARTGTIRTFDLTKRPTR